MKVKRVRRRSVVSEVGGARERPGEVVRCSGTRKVTLAARYGMASGALCFLASSRVRFTAHCGVASQQSQTNTVKQDKMIRICQRIHFRCFFKKQIRLSDCV